MLSQNAQEDFDEAMEILSSAIAEEDLEEAQGVLPVLLSTGGGEPDCHDEIRHAVGQYREAFGAEIRGEQDFPPRPPEDAGIADLKKFKAMVGVAFIDDPREDVLEDYLAVSVGLRAKKKTAPPNQGHRHTARATQPKSEIPTWALVAGAVVLIGGIAMLLILRR